MMLPSNGILIFYKSLLCHSAGVKLCSRSTIYNMYNHALRRGERNDIIIFIYAYNVCTTDRAQPSLALLLFSTGNDKINRTCMEAEPVNTLSSLGPCTQWQGRRQISHSNIARQMERHNEQGSIGNADTNKHLHLWQGPPVIKTKLNDSEISRGGQ